MASKSEGGEWANSYNGIGDWIRKHHHVNSQFSRSQSAKVVIPCRKNHSYSSHGEQSHPVGVPISVIRANDQFETKVKIETIGDVSNFSDVSSSSSSREILTRHLESKNVRSPKCAQCQNHGRQVPLKNHKRYCPWKTCQCFKCRVTHDRRKAMASQVAVRRAQAQDDARVRELATQFHEDKLKQSSNLEEDLKNSNLIRQTYNGDSIESRYLESLGERQRLGLGQQCSGGSSHISKSNGGKDTCSTWYPQYKSGCYASLLGGQQENGINAKVSSSSSSPAFDARELRSSVVISSLNALEEPLLSYSSEIHDTEQNPQRFLKSVYDHRESEAFSKLEDIAVSVKALRDVFRLSPESDFLIYRILKDYGGNFKQVSVKIFEAQCELKSWELLRQAAKRIYS
ncbi:unnamed protein product [Orchesella dallaii]|uniref:DM domain-containing protein n=1 Tax=Orchesella dallaii TaxID=48710 RepID=A0ABP1RLK3_9HEXA